MNIVELLIGNADKKSESRYSGILEVFELFASKPSISDKTLCSNKFEATCSLCILFNTSINSKFVALMPMSNKIKHMYKDKTIFYEMMKKFNSITINVYVEPYS